MFSCCSRAELIVISDNSYKAEVYVTVAEAQVAAKDLAEARKTIDQAKEAAAMIGDNY